MFPVTSATEMAGHAGENEIADAAAAGDLPTIWSLLAQRLQAIPEYVALFGAAFEDVESASDVSYAHAANAIAAFEGSAWRATNSPYDRYLRGDKRALSRAAWRGMWLFTGKAQCGTCHSGVFQTDHQFHSAAVPQIGPGKGDGAFGYEDFGRERVTADPNDRYRFRTPSLRNVAQTGPWGHDGVFETLLDAVLHHFDPQATFDSLDLSTLRLPSVEGLDEQDGMAFADPAVTQAILGSSELPRVRLSPQELEDLMDFLVHGLTDPGMLDLRSDVPIRVPSGLPVRD